VPYQDSLSLNDKVAETLMARSDELFATAPIIKAEVLARQTAVLRLRLAEFCNGCATFEAFFTPAIDIGGGFQ
jgi:hypothetical protein